MHSLVTLWLARCGLVALCLNPIDATASTIFGMENGPMPVCDLNSAPWCGRPLIHEPNPEYVVQLTPEQVTVFMTVAQTAINLLRDGVPFAAAQDVFGKMQHLRKNRDRGVFSRHDLPGVYFEIGFDVTENRMSDSVNSVAIRSSNLLLGVGKQLLEEQLGLQRASNYVAFSLDPRTDVGFSYEVGLDTLSCYPVSIGVNFFKDEAYATIDPRADQEAKYLGPVIMRRSFMTPEEEVERARRVPQCRSRQPAPRSGLWTPIIPHDVPNAEYFKRHEALAYRVNKGHPMISVGIGSPVEEARVLWTWVGE